MSKPARGRRIGIRMLEMYTEELRELFIDHKSLLNTRKQKKIEDLRDAVHQEVGRDEVLKKVVELLEDAHQRHDDAERLEGEAQTLREKAKTIASISKIIDPNSIPEYGNYHRPSSMNFKDSDEIDELLQICVMGQPETLDIMELDHRHKDFRSRLNLCVTMEQCVELLEEAKKNVIDL